MCGSRHRRMRVVPPPTRGWSPERRGRGWLEGGSPAHAGMVPPIIGSNLIPAWFPRPRGDGPWIKSMHVFRCGVPPPTRGWSRSGGGVRARNQGSPAHAGMVPRSKRRLARVARFPRPRGDGPFIQSVEYRPRMVPPPTRGWSPVKFARPDCVNGSPAHAGMVPPHPARAPRHRRFPRPRGDGPVAAAAGDAAAAVPPPTRGWSRLAQLLRKA